MEGLTVESTSRHSAKCEDVVLRQTSTTRVIFRPMPVDNKNDKRAAVKGAFLCQKKGADDKWEDEGQLHLARFKKDDKLRLALDSQELLDLYEQLTALYQIFSENGIPRGRKRYVATTSSVAELAALPDHELDRLLQARTQLGTDVLGRLLGWALRRSDLSPLLDQLQTIGPDGLRRLHDAIDIRQLRNSLEMWQQNQGNGDEEFWQQELTRHPFVLEQVFSFPVTVVQGKAYVGGKSIDNTGGHICDFLVKNKLTENAGVVEIKTPATALLGPKYRDTVYSLSKEVIGAVGQVLNYKDSLQRDVRSLTVGSNEQLQACDPPCVVIVGHAERELDDRVRRTSFELVRRQFVGVQIITFDELFERAHQLLRLFSHSERVADASTEDDGWATGD